MDYSFLYFINVFNVREIKVTPNKILIVYHHDQKNGSLKLKLLSVHDGSLIKEYNYLPNKSFLINFVELFDDRVFIKYENEPLRVIDIMKNQIQIINLQNTENIQVDIFVYLYNQNIILMFKDRSVKMMDLKGYKIRKFENHILVPKFTFSLVQINESQRLMISSCREPLSSTIGVSQIHISSILTGKLLAKIETLYESSCLFFNDSTHELLVADINGNITIYN